MTYALCEFVAIWYTISEMYFMQEKTLTKHISSVEHIPQNGAEMQPVFEHTERDRESAPISNEGRSETAQAIQNVSSTLTKKNRSKIITAPVRDTITVEVEKIMEEGLRDAFVKLPLSDREMFKIKGEQTAYKIRDQLRASHVKVKKIFALLLEWLKLLPGVNRFFLEQEAKIKADKILSLHNRK
jgi:hypothetical protein